MRERKSVLAYLSRPKSVRVKFILIGILLPALLFAQEVIQASDDAGNFCGRHITLLPGVYTDGAGPRVMSPDSTRSFILREADYSSSAPLRSNVNVYDEHSKRMLLIVLDNHAQYSPVLRWIDERALHIRLWLGRIIALSVIVDVEKAQVLYCVVENHAPDQERIEQ